MYIVFRRTVQFLSLDTSWWHKPEDGCGTARRILRHVITYAVEWNYILYQKFLYLLHPLNNFIHVLQDLVIKGAYAMKNNYVPWCVTITIINYRLIYYGIAMFSLHETM